MGLIQRYYVGKDFTDDEYRKWLEQLTWWVGSRMTNVEDPRAHSEKVLKAAMNGTKLDGKIWNGMSNDFFKRVKQLIGFDLELGIPIREPVKRRVVANTSPLITKDDLPPLDLQAAMTLRENYIKELIQKYPHLDTPVYKPKVEELAETVVKSRMISTDFLTSRGQALERLSKIRESLHKQIGELMEFLEISPKQRVTKALDSKNADVGSLIARLESYGESWKEYEKLDALRELIQLYRMLKSTRPDGTQQLNDWELWHMTRNRPVTFTCKCGESYELLGGFLPEEIEAALLQANDVYGFGLEEIAPEKAEIDLNVVAKITDFENYNERIAPPEDDI